jgi:large subunit ribosomal protein L10
MDRQGKLKLKEELADKFNKSNGVILAEYRGMTVGEVTDLRVKLREIGAEFKVVKNRVAKKAIELDVNELTDVVEGFKGPIGIICAYEDSAQAAKLALEFDKNNKNFNVTVGHMDGSALAKEQLKAIADLPSKEVLLGQIVGSIVAPHRGLLGVLNGLNRNLVQVINAIKDTKS